MLAYADYQNAYKKAVDFRIDDFLLTIHKEIDLKYEIDDNELVFISNMLFEGGVSCRTLSYTNADINVVKRFKEAAQNIGIPISQPVSKKDFEYYVSQKAVPILKKYGIMNCEATNKRLPQSFFKMSLRQKYIFISIMFMTDGYFCMKAGSGGIALANEKLIDDIQTLLSMCGIVSSKTFKPNNHSNAWVLNIGRSQLKKIYKKCYLGNKKASCKKLLEKDSCSLTHIFPNAIGKTLHCTRKNGFRCDNSKNISLDKMQRMAKVYPELNKYLDMDFIYDRVVKIEDVGVKKLVHIQVSGTQNFIVNGFVSHNTMLVSEYFPAWYLGRNPEREVIAATYAFDRANDIGRKVRNQLISPYHQATFPECQISPDSKGANKFSTVQDGMYYSVGVGGPITGRGANLFIIDDPIKGREDADSDRSQEKLRDWFKAVAYTRLMDNNAIIVIMTRWTFFDLAGFLLEETAHEKWTVLDLPAIADSDADIIGRTHGDALWPTKYGRTRLEKIRKTIGTREWNALYQQQPLPEGGGIVDIDWFKKYPYESWQYIMMPDMEFVKSSYAGEKYRRYLKPKFDAGYIAKVNKIVCSWDTAFKESQLNDPSACTTWGMAKDRHYLMNVINERMTFPRLKKAVVKEYERCKMLGCGEVTVLIEDKASGQSLIQELQRFTRIPIIPIKSEANKQVRLAEVSPQIEAGNVWIPERGDWVVPYETQLAQFPYGKFDDMVDSTSQYLRWATRPRYVRSKKPLFWK